MRFGNSCCLWGRGLYFAEESSYSASGYSHCTNDNKFQLLVCRVLVGEFYDYGTSTQKLTHPPKKPNSKENYDSVKGITGGVPVYIVYNNGRCLPEYLITYS